MLGKGRGAMSCPSFDTGMGCLLLAVCRERKGFGSEGRRFFDQEHDLPGPGTYQLTQHNPLEFKHDSIGKRGYGPMASRSGRFKHKGRFTGPGPGDYRAEIVRATQTSFNRAPVTANFHAAVSP